MSDTIRVAVNISIHHDDVIDDLLEEKRALLVEKLQNLADTFVKEEIETAEINPYRDSLLIFVNIV